jgi:MFS family permease
VYSWNFYTLLTQLPSYLSLELHLNPDQAGWILCMAYLLMLATSVFAGIVADRILIARLATRSTIRKCAEIVSVLLPSVLLYAGSMVSQPRLSIYLLISAIGFMGFCSAGHHTNYLEISRSLTGILMGVGNTLTCLAGSRSLISLDLVSQVFSSHLPAVIDFTIRPFQALQVPSSQEPLLISTVALRCVCVCVCVFKYSAALVVLHMEHDMRSGILLEQT